MKVIDCQPPSRQKPKKDTKKRKRPGVNDLHIHPPVSTSTEDPSSSDSHASQSLGCNSVGCQSVVTPTPCIELDIKRKELNPLALNLLDVSCSEVAEELENKRKEVNPKVLNVSEVANELDIKRKGVNPPVLNLLETLLRATCAILPFRDLLEERLRVFSADDLAVKASIQELAELRLLDIIKGYDSSMWNNLQPIAFLVKVLENLDSLDAQPQSAGSVFSICMDEVIVCEKCHSLSRSTVNLGALCVDQSLQFKASIDADEIRYFNREKAAMKSPTGEEWKRYIAMTDHSSGRTLERLLIDCYCAEREEKRCSKCCKKERIWNVRELQSLSSGLIVVLPKGKWRAADVPESLKLEDCPAARGTFYLRAAVFQETCSEENHPWVCVGKLTPSHDQCEPSQLLLFYERNESAVQWFCRCAKTLICYRELVLCGKYIRGKVSLCPWIMRFQQLKNTIQTTIKTAIAAIEIRKKAYQRQLEREKAERLARSRRVAGLETALRGLFSIKAFADFFALCFFTPEQAQASQVLRDISAIYELQKRQSSLLENLEMLMTQLYVEDCQVHECITNLLSKCDTSAPMESGNSLSEFDYYMKGVLFKQRMNKCKVLHDVFSVLVKTSDIYCSIYPWKYCRILDIPLKTQVAASVIGLETCITQQLLVSSYFSHPSSNLQYIGTALIIRLFEEKTEKPHGKLVVVPRTLDMTSLRVFSTPVYHLRAIVNYPENPQQDTFAVQRIDDSDETTQMLKRGCKAYLLFYEQEERRPSGTMAESAITSTSPQPKSTEKLIKENPEKRRIDLDQRDSGKKVKVDFRYGLRNLGNTCFMNAALNSLYSLHSFRTYFASFPAATRQHPILRASSEFCTKHTQQEVPSDVLYQFKSAIPEFDDGRQHCANSYAFNLLMLFDRLIVSKCPNSFAGHPFENKLRQYRAGKCEPLHDIFSALAENLFICKECLNTWRNFSYFRTVDVPIPYNAKTVNEGMVFSENNFYPETFATTYDGTPESERVNKAAFRRAAKNLTSMKVSGERRNIDLHMCFKYMLRASLMSRENKMPCSVCRGDTQHYKQSFFRQLSTALVIHFQRFDERTRQKLNTPIHFPMELDMSQYCVNDRRQYVLRGVVYHMGDLDYGHYTACISVNGRWYNVNDSYVREMREDPPKEDAYMLFYEEEMSTRS